MTSVFVCVCWVGLWKGLFAPRGLIVQTQRARDEKGGRCLAGVLVVMRRLYVVVLVDSFTTVHQ